MTINKLVTRGLGPEPIARRLVLQVQSVAARSNCISRALPVSFRPTNAGVTEFNQLLGEVSATTDDFFVIQIGACDGAERSAARSARR